MCFLSRDSMKRSSAAGGGAKGVGGFSEETRLVLEAANMAFCFCVCLAPLGALEGMIAKSMVVSRCALEMS